MLFLRLCLLGVAPNAVSAAGLDDFYNNLASDLGPLLALFGDQITKQYLSECIDVLDYIIFAMAPVGILTAMVSVIRVCGSPSLRSFVGRAQESASLAEFELCPSTSRDICELYNKGSITRIFGQAKLLEIVHDPQLDSDTIPDGTQLGQDHIPDCGIFFLQDYLARADDTCQWKETSCASSQDIEAVRDKDAGREALVLHPNLSLNICIKNLPRHFSWIAAITGFILQAGVIVTAWFITFHTNLGEEERRNIAQRYGFNLIVLGTISLCLGMFWCSYLIGETTEERVFSRNDSNLNHKTRIFWLQQGNQRVGDQTWDAFAYNDSILPLETYTMSMHRPILPRPRHKSDSNILRSPKPNHKSEVIYALAAQEPIANVIRQLIDYISHQVWMAVLLTLTGFVVQFVGMRSSHSGVAISQLIAVLVMSAIRGGLRIQRMEETNNRLAAFPDRVVGHELDWLAIEVWRVVRPRSVTPRLVTPRSRSIESGNFNVEGLEKHPPLWRFVKFTQLHGKEVTPNKQTTDEGGFIRKTLGYRTRLAYLTSGRSTKTKAPDSRLDWGSDGDTVRVRAMTERLSSALYGMVDILFPYQKCGYIPKFAAIATAFTTQTCLHKQEPLELMSRNDEDAWIVHPLELEAILGLWLWSLKCETFLEPEDDPFGRFPMAEDIKKRWIFATGIGQPPSERLELELNSWFGKHHLQLTRNEVKDSALPLAPATLWSPSAHPGTECQCEAMRPATEDEQRFYPQKLTRYFNTALLTKSHPSLECGCSVMVATTPGALAPEEPVGKPLWITSFPLSGSLLTTCAAELFCLFLSGLFEAGWEIGGETRLVQKGSDFLLENTPIFEIAKLFEANGLGTAHEALMRIVSVLKPKDRIALNAHDEDQRTRLSHASEGGDDNLVRLLLEVHAVEPDAKDDDDQTPLSYAAEGGHDNVVKRLLNTNKVNPDVKDDDDRTPLSYAAEGGYDNIVGLLLDKKNKLNLDAMDSEKRTPLGYAARGGHDMVVKRLLKTKSVDVNLKDYGWRAPLLHAAVGGHEAVVELLLPLKQIDVDAGDGWGVTPLAYASKGGHDRVVELLLATKKANPNARNDQKRTPLLQAAKHGHEAAVKRLLREDVDPDAQDDKQRTPLSYAAEGGYKHTVQLLLATKRVDVNSRDWGAWTTLLHAAANGHDAVVRMLLQVSNVDVNAREGWGRTTLLLAAKNGHTSVVSLLLEESSIEVNAKSDQGRTPLSEAVKGEHEAIVKLLLDTNKTDPDAQDERRRTPLSYAEERGHEGIIKLLLSKSNRSTLT